MNHAFDDVKTPEPKLDAIPGAASDALMHERPGVPMEKDPPSPAGNAHWVKPDRMTDPGYIQKRPGLEELTPVFGTTVPPRGISGAMRVAAYKIPEHFTSRWLILLAADRVDVLEDRFKGLLPLALVAGGLYLAFRPKKTLFRRIFA